MAFPASFGSHLSAVMEVLLKALVVEVTAAVEDRVVELRLEIRDRDREIRDRDREIREKERGIEQRDREIAQLRAAVEELRAREEAAVSPGREERPEEETETCQQQVWTKEEEEDTESLMKWEPTDFLTAPSPLRAPLSSTSETASSTSTSTAIATTATTATATCSNDKSSPERTQSFSAYSSQETDFSHYPQADLSPSLLNITKDLFPSQGHFSGFRCDQCGKTFTGKTRLITHQSVHTGARPYSCQKCGKRFTRSDSLGRHQKMDTCCK